MYGSFSSPPGEGHGGHDESSDPLLGGEGSNTMGYQGLPGPDAVSVRSRRNWTNMVVLATGLLLVVALINPAPSKLRKRASLVKENEAVGGDALLRLQSRPLPKAVRAAKVYGDLSEEEKQSLWESWKDQYGKSYTSDDEESERFSIFKGNLEKIDALNSRSKTATYSVTRWADLTKEEYSDFLGLRLPKSSTSSSSSSSKKGVDVGEEVGSEDATYLGAWDGETCYTCSSFPELSSYSSTEDLPDTFDWRDYGAVTRVKDQGGCGSCWSFSAVGDMEGSWFVAGHDLEALSEQQILACDMTDFVCDGGYPASAFRYIITAGGSVTESTCSYNYTELTYDTLGGDYCQAFHDEAVATFTGWVEVSHSATTEDLMRLALVKLGPLSVAINAESQEFYMGGVDDPSVETCPNTYEDLDHAVLLVGWGVEDGVDFWVVKNSWSDEWGEKGYWRVIRGTNACGIALQVDHSIATSSSSSSS